MIRLDPSTNKANQLFAGFSDQVLPDIALTSICFDSREVSENSVFIALGSVAGNQREYVSSALEKGCVLVLFDVQEGDLLNDVCDERCFGIQNLKQKVGDLLHHFYGDVTDEYPVVGITGTNGKSSISFYISQLMTALNSSCAVMGTLGYGHPDSLIETGMTTLPLEKLHGVLAELSKDYAAVAMEVSSHGLHQNRLAGVRVAGAIFCNLSHDHLDYHGTMDSYAQAKAELFKRPNLEFAIINGDDEYAGVMAKDCTAKNVIRFGQGEHCDVRFIIKSITDKGLALDITYPAQSKAATVVVPLYGAFNAYNAVAAMVAAMQLGFDFDRVIEAVSALHPVMGRMHKVSTHDGQPLVLVDYAHTPDALEQVLSTCREHCKGRLSVVVGCGGDRDQAKRPLMGEIAARYADSVIVTSDNPRSEPPAIIIKHMVATLSASQYSIQEDRASAIETAIKQSNADDLVLIAGKGHEDYQEINGQRSYFSDIDAAKAVLEERP